jgi:TPR repeat protein
MLPFVLDAFVQMDNCAGTNKSQFVFGGFALLLTLGLLDVVRPRFMIAGHTKFGPDVVAQKIAEKYNKADVFNHAQLNERAAHHASVKAYDGTAMLRTYRACTPSLFGAVTHINSYRLFTLVRDDGLFDIGDGLIKSGTDAKDFPGSGMVFPEATIEAAINALRRRSAKRVLRSVRAGTFAGVGAGSGLFGAQYSGYDYPTKAMTSSQLSPTDARAIFETGLDYYRVGDETKAMFCYRRAADLGHAGAQFKAGSCYKYGRGVPEDRELAMSYFRKAAEQGLACAQGQLGTCYKHMRDLDMVSYWYALAAENGDIDSMYALGDVHMVGFGNAQEGARFFRIAAENGHAMAQYRLGMYLARFFPVTDEAARYFELAAAQGVMRAQVAIGVCYREGAGVEVSEHSPLPLTLVAVLAPTAAGLEVTAQERGVGRDQLLRVIHQRGAARRVQAVGLHPPAVPHERIANIPVHDARASRATREVVPVLEPVRARAVVELPATTAQKVAQRRARQREEDIAVNVADKRAAVGCAV